MLKKLMEYITENQLGEIIENADVKNHTYVKTGGNVKILYLPKDVDSLIEVCKYIKKNNINSYVIGRGSNLLFPDGERDMVVIKISKVLDHLSITGTNITVGAGYSLQALARTVSKLGLSGLEFAGGIPGAVGGSTFMNAGAHTGDMSKIIKKVTTIDRNGKIKTYTNSQCQFSYRHSIFQENNELIVEVELALEQKDVAEVFKRMTGNLEYRKEMQPLDMPSFGSTFRNPAGYHAGKLIEDAGLKGYTIGGAQISEKHANFIINTGMATTADFIELIKLTQAKIEETTGLKLYTEVRIVD